LKAGQGECRQSVEGASMFLSQDEMGNAKWEMRNSKFETNLLELPKIRNSNSERLISHFAFRISQFALRIPHFEFPLPSHPLGQGGYVSYVMPPVPRVERDVLFQTHDSYIGV
jgi:hypothetical protein